MKKFEASLGVVVMAPVSGTLAKGFVSHSINPKVAVMKYYSQHIAVLLLKKRHKIETENHNCSITLRERYLVPYQDMREKQFGNVYFWFFNNSCLFLEMVPNDKEHLHY